MGMRKTIVLLGALILTAALPVSASAQRLGRPDLEGAVEVHSNLGLARGGGAGLGVDLRGTYWAASEPGFRAGPEAVVGLANFWRDGRGSGLLRLMGGARIAFDSGPITPAVYGRIGLHPWRGSIGRRWWWGGPWFGLLGLEGGAALDVNVAPNASFGGHLGLNLLNTEFAYLNLGAHFSVKF